MANTITWLAVLLLGAAPSRAAEQSRDWASEARTDMPDRLSVEIELRELGVEADSASWLSGETAWSTDAEGQTQATHSLRWIRLKGSPVLAEASAEPSEASHCVRVEGRDPVPGGRVVHLYRSTVGAEVDARMHAALTDRPGVVLASGEAGEAVLVSLRPGDQVLLVDVEHGRTGVRSERLELHRGARWLTLHRDGGPPRACYGQLQGALIR